ncbi:MAG: UDP-3-O-acyl-N-acetylglucosamine deacetylase [Rickettsiales bacterium]|jgi:UDP-3-O-acyl-N-acetylglucosamine deacetylase|nr:UDP-3-O-acyl-N-acetylglucosamine deacetylase [Rickettsiales bacterium]
MYNDKQCTIAYRVSLFGHPRGDERNNINVSFLPADVDTGIIFKRTDTQEQIRVNFDVISVENLSIHTKIVKNVENVLVALWANRIDNIIIEVDGDSFPYTEGISESISLLLTTAGIKVLSNIRRVNEIKDEIKTPNILIKKSTSFVVRTNDFEFDDAILPYKDWLSRISKNNQRYPIVFIIALLFVGGFSYLDLEIKKVDEREIFETIKKIY